MQSKYIMKSHQPNIQKEEWLYDILDDKYEYITSVTLLPEIAKRLELIVISPIELHNARTKLAPRIEIEPLTSDNYAIKVVHPIKNHFVIVDLKNNLYSKLFVNDTFMSFCIFKDCHNNDMTAFDTLCKQFIDDDTKTMF